VGTTCPAAKEQNHFECKVKVLADDPQFGIRLVPKTVAEALEIDKKVTDTNLGKKGRQQGNGQSQDRVED
jgi:hypothetical protein